MNINRDYLIINDVKKSNVKLDNGSIFFYITDKNTQNIFVNLVINVSNNDLIQKYANIENAEDYTLTMNIVKPDNTYKVVEGKLHDKENAIFEFNLSEDCCNEIGTYRCELLTKCNINNHEEITTSNKLTYKVKSSVLNDLDDIVEAPEYPIVIQLFDKLSDIEQYEEDRRTNELTRQLAEEQRQTRFNALDADMTNSIQAIDDKVVDVENRIVEKEQAVDKLIVDTKADIDEYKVAKDQEINNAITAQDNKIDTTITSQNDRITVIENNVVAQNNKLDTLQNKITTHEARITATEAKNIEQDNRLDVAENRLANIGNDITNTMQPIIDGHTSRLDAIEAIDVAQNTRLDAIEVKNQQQDDRLLDIEKVNKRQDMDLKCLFAESKNNMIDVTEEGNSIYLQNSTVGYTLIDEIQGNTMVNCNKEADKELILNGNINTQGYSNVTLTEGVDGGLVDVALEGNTMVNVCDQKDPVAITKSYTVETGNHVALQGEYDGKCRPVVTGNTLWIDNDTDEVLTAFDESKNLRLQSSFEDKVVTQEMVDNGEELAENLGKYKVDYKTVGKNKFDGELEQGSGKGSNSIGIHYTQYQSDNNTRCRSKNLIDVIPNTRYTVSYSDKGFQIAYWEIDKNGIVTKDSGWMGYNIGKITFNTMPTTRYLKFVFEKKGMNITPSDILIDIQLEEGNTATSYEPYKESTKTLYLNSPLLEGDTIEEKDGGIYHVHRCKEVVLDGNRNWEEFTDVNSTLSSVIGFFTEVADIKYRNGTEKLLCDHFPTGPYNPNNSEGCELGGSPHIHIYVSRTKLQTQDKAGFIQYITENPATAVYELAEPQYEPIEQSNLAIPSYANGHLDFNTAIPVEKVDFKPFSEELTYLYANTQYTVQFISDKATTADITLGGTQLLAQSIVNGLNRVSITTPSELVDSKLVISGVGANISKVVVTDTNREFGYFEDMKSVGECEDLEVVSCNSDSTLSNTQTLTHEPLRAVGDTKDRYVLIDGKWYIERNCGVRAYQEGDIDNYITDMINTIYPLSTPTYEPIDYNPFTVYSDVTHISNNSTIPCNMTIKNTGYNCLLKPSTTYTVSSNLGLNTVTTPSILTEDCLRFYDTDTSDVTTMKDVLVLEGDWTSKADLIPANFSGIESAFEQEYDAEKGKYKVNIKVANEDKSKENNITFYINEQLRGVGDVKDRLYIKDDKVVVQRNYIVKTINGSENGWEMKKDNGSNITFLLWDDLFADAYSNSPCICNLFTRDITPGLIKADNSMRITEYNGTQKLFLVPTKEKCYDLQSFKQWLQQNPVTVVYQLAEPTYEEIEYNDVKLFIESFKNSTLSYNSNVPVTSKLYYSYSVPIVDTVAQTASISDEQDNMIIELATQVAVMEMMLM